MRIFRSCHNTRYSRTFKITLDLEAGVHICHILKQLLRRLYRYSLSAKRYNENIGQNNLARKNLYGQSRQPGLRSSRSRYYQETAAPLFSRRYTNRKSLGQDSWPVITTQYSCLTFCFDIHTQGVTESEMKKGMTGNGHIELLNVTRYNFQPSRAR